MYKVLFSGFLCHVVFFASSQKDSSGIYSNVKAFEHHKLTHATDCKSSKHSVRLHEFWDSPFITIINDHKKYKYNKADIFGFRDCKNCVYRFFMNAKYEIVNTDDFFLYRQIQDTWDDDIVSVSSAYVYFFSIKADSEIYPLRKRYLTRLSKDNGKFVDLVNTSFKSDDDLCLFNTKVEKFKIVLIYKKSME